MLYTSQTGERRTLFDAETAGMAPKVVLPESEQELNESRRSVHYLLIIFRDLTDVEMNRLWSKLTEAIKNKNMEAATNAKNIVEDAQRESVRRREEHGIKYESRFFRVDQYGRWLPKIE